MMAGWQLRTSKMRKIQHRPAFQAVSPSLPTALHLPFQAAILSCVWRLDLGLRSCWQRIPGDHVSLPLHTKKTKAMLVYL